METLYLNKLTNVYEPYGLFAVQRESMRRERRREVNATAEGREGREGTETEETEIEEIGIEETEIEGVTGRGGTETRREATEEGLAGIRAEGDTTIKAGHSHQVGGLYLECGHYFQVSPTGRYNLEWLDC